MKTKNYTLKRIFLIILAFQFFSIHSVFSINYVFDGVGNYTDVSLWTPSYPGGSIGFGDNVTIMNGAVCTLPGGTGLFIQGNFINNGELITFNTMGCFGNGVLVNNGTVLCHAPFDNLGQVVNNGMFTTELTFSNQGSADFFNSSTGVIVIHNSFIVSTFSGNSVFLEGMLKGGGTVHITNFPNEGIINPGFSPGTLTFQSGLDLKNNGTLQIELAGNAGAGVAGGHDQIQVTNGNGLVIDGTLEVILLNGFTPNIGDSWTIATGTTSGSFSNLILPSGYNWDVDIQAGSIVLEVISIALPVEMSNFFGKANEKDISLYWTTLSEVDHAGWDIEYISESNDWLTLGFVEGAGGGNVQHYSFTHKNPRSKINYYRLKQIDFDGKTEYSNIIAVDFSFEHIPLSVYPNPSNGKLFFSKEIKTVEVINMQGKSILIKKVDASELDLTGVASGEYFLLVGMDKNRSAIKIILE